MLPQNLSPDPCRDFPFLSVRAVNQHELLKGLSEFATSS